MAVPIRTCLGCLARRPQQELLRFRRRSDGSIVASIAAASGRTAYLCPSFPCFARASRRRAFERALGRGERVRHESGELWGQSLRAIEDRLQLLRRTDRTDGSMESPRHRAVAALQASMLARRGD